MGEPRPVLVTGASGYIALHVVRQLLDAGHAVRGTLRSLARADELRAALGPDATPDRLSFVEADLTSDAGWNEAAEGCDLAVHTASPVPMRAPLYDDELIVPAKEGALRLLRAAAAAGLRRVVMTSSIAAVGAGRSSSDARPFTEADWTDLTRPIDAYSRSKTLAEQAAWNFVAGLPAARRPELVTINPGLVFGPTLAQDHSPSLEVIRKLLAREVPGCPRLGWSLVDVRDVAAAHIAALTVPGAAGHRYICVTEFLWIAEIARVLAAHLAESGRSVPTLRLPDWLVRLFSLFDPTVRMVVNDLGRRSVYDASAIRRDLDWQPRDLAETIGDTADSLIAKGIV